MLYPGGTYCASWGPFGGPQATVEVALGEPLLVEVRLFALTGLGRYLVLDPLLVEVLLQEASLWYSPGVPPVGLTTVESGGPLETTDISTPELEYFVEGEGLDTLDVEEPLQPEYTLEAHTLQRTVE